jgi:hypothetical protein
MEKSISLLGGNSGISSTNMSLNSCRIAKSYNLGLSSFSNRFITSMA